MILMNGNIHAVSASLHDMSVFLKEKCQLPAEKLWENTHIKHQIDRREAGGNFTISDHIRAMVYSMLSAGISWERMDGKIDLDSGRILPIDEAFHQFEPKWLLQATPEQLWTEVKRLHCGSQYTNKQMAALIQVNIPKLLQMEAEHGGIDLYYKQFLKRDSNLMPLVRALSGAGSKDKLAQMGEALIAEYLRNVGYDLAKPDRHIRRILGSDYLGCSKHKIVPVYEAFAIVEALAKESGLPAAEVDYILWSYCAKGYGDICNLRFPKCGMCIAKEICIKNKGDEQNEAFILPSTC